MDSKEYDLLEHPLIEAFIHLKWRLVQHYFYLNFMMFFLLMVSLIGFDVVQNELIKCYPGWNDTIMECGESNKKIFIKVSVSFYLIENLT